VDIVDIVDIANITDIVRARRGFGEDSKEQYKFYLNLRVYSSCRVQDVA